MSVKNKINTNISHERNRVHFIIRLQNNVADLTGPEKEDRVKNAERVH